MRGGRSGSGWIDVTVEGETVGFIVIPTKPHGTWHCYLDKENANSERVGSASSKDKAIEVVRRAAS